MTSRQLVRVREREREREREFSKRERERDIKEAGVDLYRERKLYDINSKRLAWMLEERERNCKTSRRLVRMLGHGGGGERERTDRQTDRDRERQRQRHTQRGGWCGCLEEEDSFKEMQSSLLTIPTLSLRKERELTLWQH